MKEFSKYVGLDVHKESIAVSVAEANGGEVRNIGEIANTPEEIEKLVKQLRKGGAKPQLMAYLGVVPSEHSSGGTKSRGGITKTGKGHVRRVLVEAAWTYRHPARKTAVLQRRAEQTSEVVQEIAWKAQTRLCGRYRLFEARGKLKVQACVAIARELSGFIWAIGQALPQPTANA